MNRPIIGIPIGDPSGIGPEIVVKALNQAEIYKICKPVVIGDKNTILQAMKFCRIELSINTVTEPENGKYWCSQIAYCDGKTFARYLFSGSSFKRAKDSYKSRLRFARTC